MDQQRSSPIIMLLCTALLVSLCFVTYASFHFYNNRDQIKTLRTELSELMLQKQRMDTSRKMKARSGREPNAAEEARYRRLNEKIERTYEVLDIAVKNAFFID